MYHSYECTHPQFFSPGCRQYLFQATGCFATYRNATEAERKKNRKWKPNLEVCRLEGSILQL